MAGIGIALLFVAVFHLVPAARTQTIPRTVGKPLSRSEHPTEFWGTCIVMGGAGLAGLVLLLAALLR